MSFALHVRRCRNPAMAMPVQAATAVSLGRRGEMKDEAAGTCGAQDQRGGKAIKLEIAVAMILPKADERPEKASTSEGLTHEERIDGGCQKK